MTAFEFNTAARTDVGCRRQRNEDAHLSRPDLGLWLVADGMGGHERGDCASQLIVDTVNRINGTDSAKALLQRVEDALRTCNDELVEGVCSGHLSGATVVALLVSGAHYAGVWIGDSRLYRYRRPRLSRLTRDHTPVQDLLDRGLLRPAEARAHPLAHQVSRAVGIDRALRLDAVHDRLQPGDVFLLCSDGLTSVLDDHLIADLIDPDDLEATARCLIERTRAAGAPDNVTVVLVRADAAAAEPATLPGKGQAQWT